MDCSSSPKVVLYKLASGVWNQNIVFKKIKIALIIGLHKPIYVKLYLCCITAVCAAVRARSPPAPRSLPVDLLSMPPLPPRDGKVGSSLYMSSTCCLQLTATLSERKCIAVCYNIYVCLLVPQCIQWHRNMRPPVAVSWGGLKEEAFMLPKRHSSRCAHCCLLFVLSKSGLERLGLYDTHCLIHNMLLTEKCESDYTL